MILHARRDQSRLAVAERARTRLIAVVAIASALVAGFGAAVDGPVGVAVVVGVGLFGLVAWRPVLATYLYLATLPLLAGIERGTLVPLARPNEALLVVLVAGAMAGGYVRALRGASLQLRLHPWDLPLAAFVILATVWPICLMLLRGVPPAAADLMAVLPVCKLAGLYLLIRVTVSTSAQVYWCIRLIVGGAVVIAMVAILQVLSVGPVLAVLGIWWPTDPDLLSVRGTTTLSNAIAAGDYILIGVALLATSRVRRLLGRWTSAGAGIALVAGVLAVGQFSTWVGALVVGALLIRRQPGSRLAALRYVPLLGIAVVIGAPALLGRLSEISGRSAPQSWLVRRDNLTHLYLPELVEGGRFLVGVSPNPVVVPPDTWRDVVYLESGYLQLLWVGGVPLLVGFIILSRAVLTSTNRLSPRTDTVGACASALAIAWWMIVVLMLFDPHITMRGSGDLLFALLGIVAGRAAQEKTDDAQG